MATQHQSAGAKQPRLKAPSGRKRKARKRERDDAAPQVTVHDGDHVVEAMKRIGTTIAGKWRLHVLLGVGGMAAVYGATHRNGHRVAVKLLHPVLGYDRSLRERFLREGYAANRVDHDGVVRVLDDDELECGTAFLVMELLTGETLETRWQRAGMRLPLVEVLGVADELLCVLGAAHEKGIHHRDIKPENVFLTRSGGLKVLDFGIARIKEAMNGSVTTTRTGVALGTPAFMPPEQALGRSREIDGRSDLWAVGATMFALLSGRFVHVTESPAEMLVLAATERAPSFASVMPHIPASVAAILDRALSFEQEGRFPDAASMRRAVHEARAELGYLEPTSVAGDAAEDDDPLPRCERPTLPSPSVAPSATAPVAITTDRSQPSCAPPPPPARRLRRTALVAVVAAAAALLVVPTLRSKSHPPATTFVAQAITADILPPDIADAAPVLEEAPPPSPVASAPTPFASASAPLLRKAHPRPVARKAVAKQGPPWVGYRH